jgi:integrase
MITEIQWRPMKGLAPADKVAMPVSVAQLPHGKRMVVSRYGDDIWDFYPYIPQDNLPPGTKKLSWRIKLPDGRFLTDPVHHRLLESAKDFIWAGFMSPPEGRARPKALTIIKNARHVAPLLRWMVTRGLTRFAELDGCVVDYVPVARLSGKANSRGTETTPDTIAQRLLLVEDLFRQRDKLDDALSLHPWPLETACALAGYKQHSAHLRPKTDFIPSEVAAHLARTALQYIQQRSSTILITLEAAYAAARDAAGRGASGSRQADARTAAARKAGYKGFREVTAEAVRLRTACYIIIDMFSGIRDSEMVSLEEGCLHQGTSNDGTTTLWWMHGTIYKTGHRPKKWLVPSVVHEAVQVLSRLTAPLREQMRREQAKLTDRIRHSIASERARLLKRLTLVSQQHRKLFLCMSKGTRNGCPSALAGAILNKDLKNFCAELGIHGTNSKPYPLHAHQFRRTYARSVAQAELGDLMYLRDHFGHWSIDMTLYYADGAADDYDADTELLEMVAQEKLARQNEIVSSYLTTDEPLANGNHWLKQWRRAVRTAKNKEELIAEYAGTMTLNGTGHSWCIGNARGNGCGGLCVLQAQMCVDCNYGVIGQEHRSVWEGIRDQQLEALALDDMGPGGQARAKEILCKAQTVLRRLDGKDDM